MYRRVVEEAIDDYLRSKDNNILFMWGPRRSGKTTLMEKYAKKFGVRLFNFDLISDREYFVPEIRKLEKLVAGEKVILIDEVQVFPESTRVLKILHDKFGVKIVATGSSELRKKVGKDFDTLAGRFKEIYCLPLGLEEIEGEVKEYERGGFYKNKLDGLMTFGCYPEIYSIKDDSEKISQLVKLVDTYVLKDIVDIYGLRDLKLARDILKMVALQLGGEVSLREIASSLQINAVTVGNYLEIFCKNYVLIELPSFKTNLRKSISEHKKYYFYDMGVRNALVGDFRSADLRPDIGGVFENFVVAELKKKSLNHGWFANMYFYREYGGKEVDLVMEDFWKKYRCFEIKWRERKKTKKVFPLEHELEVVDGGNYEEVVREMNVGREE